LSRMSEPVQCTATQMAKVGVEIVSEPHLWLRCQECGEEWIVDEGADGNLPSGYWHCPNACNRKKR
jgi:hypothetical protein